MKIAFALTTAVYGQYGSGDDSLCPNASWEFDAVTGECVPKSSEYQIQCDSRFGLTISVNGGVLFDDETNIQPTYTGSYIRIGTCGGRIDESGDFDFKISAGWDQCGGTQQITHNGDFNEIEICFDVSGDIDAVTNPDGLVISRILSFKAQCSFDDHFSLSERFMADMNQIQGGLVDHSAGSIGDLFNLRLYQDDQFLQLGFEKSSIIGDTAYFKVDKMETARLPSAIDYYVRSCEASGLNDNGELVSYKIIDDACYSFIVNADKLRDGKGFSYDVFSFGQSAQSMQIDLQCDVKLCAGSCDDAADDDNSMPHMCKPGYLD